MNQQRIFQILLSPHISEKAAVIGDANNQYVFKVSTDALKNEIGAAVEQLFDVKVDKVRTVNVKGKLKRRGAKTGKQKDWKKAYVSLQQGSEIDLSAIGA